MGDLEYYAVKAEIYTLREASERTTISVLEPATVLLDYPGWSAWSSSPTDSEEAMMTALARATTAISVPRCGDDVHGWPGQLLLEGPTCVTLNVVGKNPDWEETIMVRKGAESC
ncbi:MAG: hypothetical protein VB036_00890 [Propionicimonas sp.]|nr:hypothetical protein [Propionicimonas sp.]